MEEDDADASDQEIDLNSGNDDHSSVPLVYAISEGDWQTKMPRKRTGYKDKVKKKGLTANSSSISSFQQAFSLFFSVEVKEIITRYTNQKGFAVHGDNWKIVDMEEMDAFLGLLIAMGANKDCSISPNDLWETRSFFHTPIYARIMSRNRFNQLISCIRFDDATTRKQRQENSRLAAIKQIADMIQESCLNGYDTSPFLTVDERIVPFCGNCKFRVYMQAKPDKYGLKMWMMADSESYYVKNFDVYLGKQDEKSEVNQSQRVVLQLSQCLGEGYNITTDNFFTSFPLAHHLLQRNITLLGTLRSNKKGIPKELLDPKRDECSSEFRFTNDFTLVSYVPKKKKNVLILSSGKPENRVQNTEKKKPMLIIAYNETKAGVDTVDKMTKQYSVKRTSRRWTFALFTSLMDISLLNAFIIYSCKFPDIKSARRKLHLLIAEEMCRPEMLKRLPSCIREKEHATPRGKRCDSCPGPRPLKRTASQFCHNCCKSVCYSHCSVLCYDCHVPVEDAK